MPERVVAVIRHREAVLCCRNGELSLPARAANDVDRTVALRDLLATLGFEPAAVERQRDLGDARVALVSPGERQVEPSDRCRDPTWLVPSTLREQGSAQQWRSYQAVAPTVETVACDTDRGSTAIAIDALWALRDAATLADGPRDLDSVRATATQLLDARPSMAVVGNRINQVMSGAGTPGDIEAAATEAIIGIHTATGDAAALAAQTVGAGPVLTLSRSGTVGRALLAGRPAVEVLVSLPGGEGREVGDRFAAAGLSVSVVADAAVYDRLRSGEIGSVLVGADAVSADGTIVNKVGTRATALAAELTGTPFYVVCASDKVRPLARTDEADLPLEPLFDVTPPRCVTAVLTERGSLTADGIHSVAAEHRAKADWRDADLG